MKQNAGFTLVESAVVLTILAIITAGILTGKDLIHAATLRAIPSEYVELNKSIKIFYEKYNAVPGDMPNATDMWGIAGGATGNDNACLNAVQYTQRTCNGDGNGQIMGAFASESMRAWQHLTNAAILKGNYYGGDSNGHNPTIVVDRGGNVPPSQYGEESLWYVMFGNYAAPSSTSFERPADNYLYLWYVTLPPEDMWNIDKKIDDGKPGTGKITAYKGDATGRCTDKGGVAPPGDSNAEYNLSVKESVCQSISIQLDFDK